MHIDILQTTDDPRNLTKSFTTIAGNVSILPSESFDIVSPEIHINYNTAYLSANYFYIRELRKYYFLSRSSLAIGREIILNLSLDVLMTFRQYLLNCDVSVIRSESAGVNYTIDKQLPIDPNRIFFDGKLFPNQPFDNADTNYQNYNYVVGVNT